MVFTPLDHDTMALSLETPPPAPTASASRPLVPLSRKPSFVEKPSASTAPLKTHRLQPKTLEPLRCSTAAAPLAFLANIERIEINETRVRHGVTHYVLDVYLYHFDTRLPSILNNPRRAALATPVAATAPDYRVERRYSDFTLLREQAFLWSCVNPQFVCDYCNEFVMYVRFKLYQPRFVTKFTTSVRQRKKLLASFLTDFVALAQFRGYHCGDCAAHEHLPHLVESFVRDQGGELAGSDHVRMPSWR